jgi:subtilisin-like proprotein convertase family protein
MKREFSNFQVIPIDSGAANSITSTITVANLPGHIRDVNVLIDIDHTWTDDLRIHVVAPDGTQVLLVAGEGGRGHNFRRTTFDDAATESIAGAEAPFRGTFRPEESLTAFDEMDANGTWSLVVVDTAFQDGGSMNRWTLNIETCSHVFDNNTRMPIDPGQANTITSSIETGNLGGMVVEDLTVMVDIDHTWDNDLKITLVGPDSTSVVLVDSEGGDRDGFDHTAFDESAPQSIRQGSAPYRGTFRPEESLAGFQGKLLTGTWTLKIEDQASQDGGTLNRWELNVHSCPAAPRVDTQFSIELEFVGGLNANQRSIFGLAAARWAEVIIGDLPTATIETDNGGQREVDDVLIRAEGRVIDGPSGTLGSAGPRIVRVPSDLPIMGEMTFDTADLADMEQDGSLIDVILHEMGHVLGVGTLWKRANLLSGSGTNDPEFTGEDTMAEYATLLSEAAPRAVPVANTGGPGTAEGHWRESTFDHELMTGFVEQGEMPMSRMTIASLRDLGYEVDMDAANPYQLPDPAIVAERLLTAAPRRSCRVTFPEILDVSADGGPTDNES